MGSQLRRGTLVLCAACLLLTPFCRPEYLYPFSEKYPLLLKLIFSFQVSPLPLFSVDLQNKIEGCGFFSNHLPLLSYDTFS